MMQRFAFLCGAAGAYLATAAPVEQALCLEDSTQLFQSMAVVSEGPREEKPKSKEVYETVQKELKPSNTFMGVIKDMQHKWKEHKVHQLEETQPWRAKEEEQARAEKAKHRGDRPEPAAEPRPKEAKALSEEERQALEQEAQIAKLGDAMTLIVREPSGIEFNVKFRSNTRFQVLMHSVCKKLDVDVEGTDFLHRDRKLDPLATPTSFGLVDQDVIEVDSPKLQAKAQDEAIRTQKSRDMEATLREREGETGQAEAMVQRQLEKRLRNAKKRAVAEAEEKRQHDLDLRDMVSLKFEHIGGGEKQEVHIAVKRSNWLQGTMDLVCKRMSVDPAKAHFYFSKNGKKVLIKPKDSVHELGLGDTETISVEESAM